MTPQELKSSILQNAVQGKLVEQRPEEGTSEEMFQQIHAKKPPFELAADDVPFDIPDTWKWVHLGDVANINGGFAFKSTNYTADGVRVIRISDFNESGFVNNKIVRHPYDDSLNSYVLEEKNILLCMTGGTVGKSLFVSHMDERMVVNQRVATIKVNKALPEYIYQVVLSPMIQKVIQQSKNSTNDNISMDTIKGFLMPLPPKAEQKRIVAKLEEILPLIDRYEAAWNKLDKFNKHFPGDMQKSILQIAIQGKLVEQRPEEGTGEDLFQQIQAEKQALIKAGKIKKEKPLPEIADEEKPYDIPANWTWVRFGELGSYKKGPFGSAITKSMFVPKGNGAVKVYEQKNAIQKDAALGDYYIRREYFESKMTGFEVFPGDIIVSCAGTIGETYVMPEQIEQGIINQALMRMKIFEPLYIPYFLMFFDFVLKKDARSSSKGSAIKNIPPFEILKNYLVPIPPLAEQKRIVAKLEEILPLCDRLK